MRTRSVFATTLMLLLSVPAYPWGHEGHRIIADIAKDHLTPASRAALEQLIGTAELANFATWADDIRPRHRETAPWHYVDIPRSATGYRKARDCADGQCVVVKLEEFSAILRDSRQPLEARKEALKWVIHLVGDIHQPFHAIGDARGGNDIAVEEFGSSVCGGRPCELHAVWDSGLLEHTGLREHAYVLTLEGLIERQHLEAAGTVETWADESFRAGRGAWVEPGTAVDEAYFDRELPVLNQRLALAGLRLAAMLNADLGKRPDVSVVGRER